MTGRSRRRGLAATILGLAMVVSVGAASAGAHNDSCLAAVHAGGFQQHAVCS